MLKKIRNRILVAGLAIAATIAPIAVPLAQPATAMAATQNKTNTWVHNKTNNTYKYIGADGKAYKGWHWMTTKEGETTEHWSYFGEDGVLRKGWQKMGTKTNPDGDNEVHWSYFGDNGWLRTNWQKMTSNPDGKPSEEHMSYFGDDGWLRTGWQVMGKTKNPDGNAVLHKSYFDENGWLLKGWQEIENDWYCFDDNGWLMTHQKVKKDGKTYWADDEGKITPIKKEVKIVFHRNTQSKDTTTHTESYKCNDNNSKQQFGQGLKEKTGQFGTWKKTGYKLLGWSTEEDARVAQFYPYQEFNNTWINSQKEDTLHLYAVWYENKQTNFNFDDLGNKSKRNKISYTPSSGNRSTVWYMVTDSEPVCYSSEDLDENNKSAKKAPTKLFNEKEAQLSGDYAINAVTSRVSPVLSQRDWLKSGYADGKNYYDLVFLDKDGYLRKANWGTTKTKLKEWGAKWVINVFDTLVFYNHSGNPKTGVKQTSTIEGRPKSDSAKSTNVVHIDKETGKNIATETNPRTFLGQLKDKNGKKRYFFGVVSGRKKDGQGNAKDCSKGFTYQDLYDFVEDKIAGGNGEEILSLYNLDGGGSSAFLKNGNRLNAFYSLDEKELKETKERPITSLLIF